MISRVGVDANKREWMDELRAEFLEILTLAVEESLNEIQASELRSNQLAVARFEQHLLPDEESFRKIVLWIANSIAAWIGSSACRSNVGRMGFVVLSRLLTVCPVMEKSSPD